MYYDILSTLSEELESIKFLLERLDWYEDAEAEGRNGTGRLSYADSDETPVTVDLRRGSLSEKSSNGEKIYNYRFVDANGERHSYALGNESSADVIAIKQVRYNDAYRKILTENVRTLDRAISMLEGHLKPYDPDSVEATLPEAYIDRTGAVNKSPGVIPDEEWRLPINAGLNKSANSFPQKAVDGQIVRSKSEVIIYNMLSFYGLDFNYEEPIVMQNPNGNPTTYFPDFVIHKSKPYTGQDSGKYGNSMDGHRSYDGYPQVFETPEETPLDGIIALEYLGDLSNVEYFNRNMAKMYVYFKSGFIFGKNLFFLNESENGLIDSQAISSYIKYIRDVVLKQ